MTPRQKAEELWLKFDEIIAHNSLIDGKPSIEDMINLPKRVALAAVDEIIKDRINSEPMSSSPTTAAWMIVRHELEQF
jgi:hypothetical protein